MAGNKIKNFIVNNSVAIVMIPTVIGLHWGWNEIQHNDKFVKPSERKELPIMIVSIGIYLTFSFCIFNKVIWVFRILNERSKISKIISLKMIRLINNLRSIFVDECWH